MFTNRTICNKLFINTTLSFWLLTSYNAHVIRSVMTNTQNTSLEAYCRVSYHCRPMQAPLMSLSNGNNKIISLSYLKLRVKLLLWGTWGRKRYFTCEILRCNRCTIFPNVVTVRNHILVVYKCKSLSFQLSYWFKCPLFLWQDVFVKNVPRGIKIQNSYF